MIIKYLIKNKSNTQEILEIKLLSMDKINNIACMFAGCSTLFFFLK